MCWHAVKHQTIKNCQELKCESGLTMLRRQNASATLEFSSTVMFRWKLRWCGRLPAVPRLYNNIVPLDNQCLILSFRRWLSHGFCLGWHTVMPHSPDYQPTDDTGCCLWWILLPNWCIVLSVTIVPLCICVNLCYIHWLKSRERVDFKLAITVYKCIFGMAPQYLIDII